MRQSPAADPETAHQGSPGAVVGAVELLKALASTARLGIVLELARDERCVHELVEATGMTQPLVSQHLRVLRGAGIVVSHRRGREAVYSLTDHHLAHIAEDAVQHAEEIHR
jgi:ArsR family transcriptional regulator